MSITEIVKSLRKLKATITRPKKCPKCKRTLPIWNFEQIKQKNGVKCRVITCRKCRGK